MFQFTIREVLMAAVLVALTVCWIGDRWRMYKEVGLYKAKLTYFGHLLETNGYKVDIEAGTVN